MMRLLSSRRSLSLGYSYHPRTSKLNICIVAACRNSPPYTTLSSKGRHSHPLYLSRASTSPPSQPPQSFHPRSCLSTSTSTMAAQNGNKHEVRQNTWVGSAGASGYDLRSEFAFLDPYLTPQKPHPNIEYRRHPDNPNTIHAGGNPIMYPTR